MPKRVNSNWLVMFGLWGFMLLLVQLRPVDDVDLFWQIRTGELILQSGQLVKHDAYTYTHAGEAVPAVGWLAQAFYAQLFRLGSWPLLHAVHALLYSGAFFMAALGPFLILQRRAESSVLALLLVVLLGFLASLSNSSVRPQTIGLLCFASIACLVSTKSTMTLKLALCIPLFLIWQNSHPSVIVAVVLLLATTCASWIDRFAGKGEGNPAQLTVLLAVACIATLCTPMGWRTFEVSADNVRVARDWLQVSEWMPAWHSTLQAMAFFWVGLLLTIVLAAALHSKVRLAEILLVIPMTLLPLYATRFVPFWAIALIPVWARWLRESGVLVRPAAARQVTFQGLLIGMGLPWGAALAVPPLVRDSIFDQHFPLKAADQLQKVLPAGRIYNYREWGGILIWTGWPAWKVSIDGRLYLYGKDDWQQYNAAAVGELAVEDIVSQHRPDAFFLHPEFHKELLTRLDRSRLWREIYRGQSSVIFVRRLEVAVPDDG